MPSFAGFEAAGKAASFGGVVSLGIAVAVDSPGLSFADHVIARTHRPPRTMVTAFDLIGRRGGDAY
jgi:hypothetical protein